MNSMANPVRNLSCPHMHRFNLSLLVFSSFIRSFINLLIRSMVDSCASPFVRSWVYSFLCSVAIESIHLIIEITVLSKGG